MEEDFEHARYDEEADRGEDRADENASHGIDPDTLDRSRNHAEVTDSQDKHGPGEYTCREPTGSTEQHAPTRATMQEAQHQQQKRRSISNSITSTVHAEPPIWRLDTEPTTQTARLEPSRHGRRREDTFSQDTCV